MFVMFCMQLDMTIVQGYRGRGRGRTGVLGRAGAHGFDGLYTHESQKFDP